jgi:phosphoribosylformylglycinamidine cyclo-ligase
MSSSRYTQAGVNIDAGSETVRLMKDAVRRTYTPAVLSDTGSFGGLFSLKDVLAGTEPVLVASTDGVGTKTRVAAHMQQWQTIGQDLVNHCINDILVQGARPLFFMDYVATARLVPQQIADVVTGIATACEAQGIALLGGETAEMPGVYVEGEIDVAGTIVGVVERAQIVNGSRIAPGDAVISLPSSGLHTNGYSLARMALAHLDWHSPHPLLGASIGGALLAVHRAYLAEYTALRAAGVDVRGMAHITGGGVVENLPRVLPAGCGAHLEVGTWAIPPIFNLIQTEGNISNGEMYRVFNMGLGMLFIVPPDAADTALGTLPEARRVGVIVPDAQQQVIIR